MGRRASLAPRSGAVEVAGTAFLANSSQTAARDAWFVEFGGRRDGLVDEAVGLDIGSSPAARRPVMAAEATADAGTAFYRQLAVKHTLQLLPESTEDDTDLAVLAAAGVRRLMSVPTTRGIESATLCGSHAPAARENRDSSEAD